MSTREMRTGTLVSATICTGMILAALVGCTPESNPSPTPTPAFASEAEAFAAAEEVYRAYNDALNAVDPSDPATFEPLFELSNGAFETADRKNLSIMHAEGHTTNGDAVILSFEGSSTAAQLRTVTARVCLDVSAVLITDKSGASVVDPSRPSVYTLNVTFNLHDDELTIDAAERSEEQTCEVP